MFVSPLLRFTLNLLLRGDFLFTGEPSSCQIISAPKGQAFAPFYGSFFPPSEFNVSAFHFIILLKNDL